MSSHSYSTELTPDAFLRRVVLFAGLAATVLGLALVVLLPVEWFWRALAAIVWLGINTRDLMAIRAGQRRCQRIRIRHDGGVELLSHDGCWFPATILAGSLVLRGVAWLRFESEKGQRFNELLCRKRSQNEAWRRLQVIWRHMGASR